MIGVDKSSVPPLLWRTDYDEGGGATSKVVTVGQRIQQALQRAEFSPARDGTIAPGVLVLHWDINRV